MRSSKKDFFENPPRNPRMKSLDAIYAAEDARKAASNSPSKILDIKSEPLEFEKISYSFASEENEVSLKDLRARCKATKKRKVDAKPKEEEADDLDEPLIVLKAKRSKSSYTVRRKCMVIDVISECSIGTSVQRSKGLAEEDPRGCEKTLSMQTDCNATSASNDLTSPGAGTLGSTHHVKTESNNSFNSGSEPILEVDPIEIEFTPYHVDFIAKFDSSSDQSSNLIYSTRSNIPCPRNLICSFKNACGDIVEPEVNFYSSENSESNLPEGEIINEEVGASPVAVTVTAPDSKSLNCSFNEACIDVTSEENFYSPEKSKGSLHEDRITEVEGDVSPATASPVALTVNSPDSKSLSCSFNGACVDVQSEENFYSPEKSKGSLHEDRITEVEGDVSPATASPVALTVNAPDSKSLNCSFNEACVDVQSEENLYSPEKSKGSLHEDRITEVEGDVSPATASPVALTVNSPDRKSLNCSFNEACIDVTSEENFYSPEKSKGSLHENRITEVEGDATPATVTGELPTGENIIFLFKEACTDDVKSGENWCTPESCQNNLQGSEIAEVESDASPDTENSLNGNKATSPFNEACIKNTKYEENFYSPRSGQNDSRESENAEVEAGESAFVDAPENGSYDNNHGFLCEEASDFLGNSDFRPSEGQLESIVFSAISTSKCLYNSENDTSTSVHGAHGFSTEDSETDCNYRNGVVTNFGDNLEKEQSTLSDNGGAELEKEVKGDPRTTRERAPIKLLSNRTIISPTSQEKLCQALTGIDLCEGSGISKCKKKIQFEGCTRMKKCNMTPQNSERNLLKSRKGNLKSTGSVKMNSDKTIEFLRRQMHDFENVTNKLLKSMRFVKGVLDETLAVQSPPLSKFSPEEIKAASENSSELERTTKRWLALMSKDCNRFCKILRSADNSPSSPPVSVQKRRKIVFADEAGGTLCHIRVFNETPSPVTTAETEKADQ